MQISNLHENLQILAPKPIIRHNPKPIQSSFMYFPLTCSFFQVSPTDNSLQDFGDTSCFPSMTEINVINRDSNNSKFNYFKSKYQEHEMWGHNASIEQPWRKPDK